jgi:hypothetical protein
MSRMVPEQPPQSDLPPEFDLPPEIWFPWVLKSESAP